jgi:hypothetical protein
MSILAGTSREVLLSLINGNNVLPVEITQDKIYFGMPRLDADGVTTVLPSTAMLGREYRGYVDFRYRRIDLSKAFDVRPEMHTVGSDTLHGMLDVVNQFLGLNLTPEDVVDANVAYVTGGEQVNINVSAASTSRGYVGSFVIRYFREQPQLSNVVKVASLPVMKHIADPAVSKVDLDMLMWRQDFTSYIDTLKVRNNYWVNPTAVKAMMAVEYGFSDWPDPQVKGVADYATKDYPGANTKFARVAVQSAVVGSTYQGNALFHYNLT